MELEGKENLLFKGLHIDSLDPEASIKTPDQEGHRLQVKKNPPTKLRAPAREARDRWASPQKMRQWKQPFLLSHSAELIPMLVGTILESSLQTGNARAHIQLRAPYNPMPSLGLPADNDACSMSPTSMPTAFTAGLSDQTCSCGPDTIVGCPQPTWWTPLEHLALIAKGDCT